MIQRDFDSGSPGASTHAQPDGWDHAPYHDVYDRAGFAGTQGARADLKGDAPPLCTGTAGVGDGWGGHVEFPVPVRKGDEIWFRVRVRFHPGWSWETNGVGMKFIRFSRFKADHSNAGNYDLYFDEPKCPSHCVQPYLISEFTESGRWHFGEGPDDNPKIGAWETWEMYASLDDIPADAGGGGRARVWKNGRLLAERTDVPTLNAPDEYVSRVLLNTYWNGICEAPTRDQSVSYDDIEVRTRVPTQVDAAGNPMIGP